MKADFLKNKYVFVDLDGTLCEYRYNNHIGGKTVDPNFKHEWSQTLEEFLFTETYKSVRPLKTMQKILSKLDPEKIYIISALITSHEVFQKIEWLNKHYPFIKKENMIFLADLHLKTEVLQEYAKHLNVPENQIVFIDDTLQYLRDAEACGFNAYHITSFVE